MRKIIQFQQGFQISIINEEEIIFGNFSIGREEGLEFKDLKIEMRLEDFCGLSENESRLLKLWLEQNAEIYLRAEYQKRVEKEEKQEEERRKRHAEEKRQKKENPTKKEGYVYLVGADNGLFKIGKSKNVDGRVMEFGVKLPVKTWLVHSFKSNQYDKAELTLHEVFKEKRSHGEWFALDKDDVEYVVSIQDFFL